MNEIEQLTAERDEALASAKRAWDEVGVVSHRRDDFRNRWTEGIRKRLADRLAVQPLVDAARAWREARTAFGATRMEPEHDVLWAATERLEAVVDALTAGRVGIPDAHNATSDDELSTLEVGHLTPQFLADVAAVERLSGVPNVDLPLDEDAELADINARVASDKRVLDAAEAWRDWYPHFDSMFAPENALMAAVDARRALTGEQTEGDRG